MENEQIIYIISANIFYLCTFKPNMVVLCFQPSLVVTVLTDF